MAAFLFYMALELLLYLASALLALTQFPHRRATGTGELPARRVSLVRMAASCLLFLVLLFSIWREGGGFGVLLWIGGISLTSGMVALTLAWKPGLLAPLARVISAPFPFAAFVQAPGGPDGQSINSKNEVSQ